jgi:HEAT repeat protein
MIRFDPDDILLKEWVFEKSTEELIYQLGHDNESGRVWAAGQLACFHSDPAAFQILKTTAVKDSSWPVRVEAIRVLGETRSPSLIPFLKERSSDNASRARAAALEALIKCGGTDLAPYFQERFHNESSYLVQAQALAALGERGDAEYLPFLEKASRIESPRDVIGRAGRTAIQKIRSRR